MSITSINSVSDDNDLDHKWHSEFPYVYIDGLIGSGKTNIVLALKNHDRYFKYWFVPEHLYSHFTFEGKIFNPLQIMYNSCSDTDKFVVQHHICRKSFEYYYDRLHPRYTQWNDNLKIFEGSLYSILPFIHTYTKHAHLSNFASTYLLSEAQHNINETRHWKPGLILYLDISEKLAFERIQARKCPDNHFISLEFLKTLKEEQMKQIDQLKKKYNVIIITIDENTSFNVIMSKCYNLIRSFYRYCRTKCWLKSQISSFIDDQNEKKKFLRRYSLPSDISTKLHKETSLRCNLYEI